MYQGGGDQASWHPPPPTPLPMPLSCDNTASGGYESTNFWDFDAVYVKCIQFIVKKVITDFCLMFRLEYLKVLKIYTGKSFTNYVSKNFWKIFRISEHPFGR